MWLLVLNLGHVLNYIKTFSFGSLQVLDTVDTVGRDMHSQSSLHIIHILMVVESSDAEHQLATGDVEHLQEMWHRSGVRGTMCSAQ